MPGLCNGQFTTAQVWGGRRREDRGAEGAEGVGCDEGCPFPTGGGAGEGLFPRKKIDFGSQYGVLVHSGWYFLQFSYLFYTQNRCNLMPLPIFFFNFSLQKGCGSFSCILA